MGVLTEVILVRKIYVSHHLYGRRCVYILLSVYYRVGILECDVTIETVSLQAVAPMGLSHEVKK